ncbi:MAG: hypothetical protein ACE366_16205 [Bradymonadia bacterium]
MGIPAVVFAHLQPPNPIEPDATVGVELRHLRPRP